MRALTAAGLSRSYAFTVVREPGPASLAATLSLDARVLVATLSFHDKFVDQAACGASAGNVSTESIVEIDTIGAKR